MYSHILWIHTLLPADRGNGDGERIRRAAATPRADGIGRNALVSAPRADGINARMYYSTKIFLNAGRKDPTIASLAIGVTNVGASLVSVWIVNSFGAGGLLAQYCVGRTTCNNSGGREKKRTDDDGSQQTTAYGVRRVFAAIFAGRRPLMFIGSVGQLAGLALAAAPLLRPAVSPSEGWVIVAGLLLFVCNFAFSSGPLTWVVISEARAQQNARRSRGPLPPLKAERVAPNAWGLDRRRRMWAPANVGTDECVYAAPVYARLTHRRTRERARSGRAPRSGQSGRLSGQSGMKVVPSSIQHRRR